MENSYDNDKFFEQYSSFPRSVEGLSAAGEWHELQKLLPDFTGRRVLDVGCGFGWHCAYAAEQGAASVLGIDLSAKMLAVAGEKKRSPVIEYRRMAMEEIDFPSDSFDVVLSSLVFHYTPDFEGVCRRIHSCLAPGGDLIFSVEHPIFTAQGPQQWVEDGSGGHAHWPVDRYFEEGERRANFLGEEVVKYHRTLTSYVNTLLRLGFVLGAMVEPQPSPHLMDVPGMRDELRRPMMLLVSAKRGWDELI